MTGYARADAAFGATRLRVELKSVNGRGLDIRTRLAPGLDAFDIALRQLCRIEKVVGVPIAEVRCGFKVDPETVGVPAILGD